MWEHNPYLQHIPVYLYIGSDFITLDSFASIILTSKYATSSGFMTLRLWAIDDASTHKSGGGGGVTSNKYDSGMPPGFLKGIQKIAKI